MPLKAGKRPPTRPGHVGFQLPEEGVDPAVDRAISEASTSIQRLEAQLQPVSRVVVDLVVGINRIPHGLGKRPFHCRITPTVATIALAYALLPETTDLVAVIDMVGVDQPGAGVEFA